MSATKSGAVETAIEYLLSSGDTRYMGVAVRDAILSLEKPSPELHVLQKRIKELEAAVVWALGYTDFRGRQEGEDPYYWRKELRERSKITQEIGMEIAQNG